MVRMEIGSGDGWENGQTVTAATGRVMIEAELVKPRRAIARPVTGEFGDSEIRVRCDGDAERACRNFRRWSRIIAIKKNVEPAADHHRFIGLDVFRSQRFADGFEHKALAGEGAVAFKRGWRGCGSNSSAEQCDLAAKLFG